jgi:hypothetical protein
MTKVQVYDIESGVPVPIGSPGIPLGHMAVGDSVQFPLSKRSTVQSFASKLKRDHGKQFTVKKLNENTARVWRVK